MKQALTVLKFEYLTFIKSGVFIGMTILMMLVALIGPAIPTVMRVFEEAGGEVLAVVDPQGRFDESMVSYSLEYFNTPEEAREAVNGGRCAYAAEILDHEFNLYVSSMKLGVYQVRSQLDAMVRSQYRTEKFREAGLDAALSETILTYGPKGEIITIGTPGEGDGQADNYEENLVYAYAMIFILYFGLLMCGQYILTSVVREKTTKTMELLITSCKTGRLINGKVLGVGMAVLTQLILMGAMALLSMNINNTLSSGAEDIFIVAVKPGIILIMFIFFLLGFFAYAYVYAALASTVSRMEDANSVAGLPMMLIMVSFFSAMLGLLEPGAAWITVLSHIPFTAPFVMFMRVCLGTAANWEVILSVAMQLGMVMLLAWLGAKIYRMGTLMYGKKLKLKNILEALRQN